MANAFQWANSKGPRDKAGEGKRGKMAMVVQCSWWEPGRRLYTTQIGEKWQKEKSKEMAKLETCKISLGRQEVCGFHSEGQDQALKTPAYTSPVGSPG